MSNEIEVIDELSNKVGIATDKMHDVMLTQAKLELCFDIFWVGLFVGIFWHMYRSYKNSNKRFDVWGDELPDGRQFVYICLALLGIIVIHVGLGDIIQILVNPEYWAIKNIFNK